MFENALRYVRENRPILFAMAIFAIGASPQTGPTESVSITATAAIGLVFICILTLRQMKANLSIADSRDDAIAALKKFPAWLVIATSVIVFLAGARLGHREANNELMSSISTLIWHEQQQVIEAFADEFGEDKVIEIVSRVTTNR